MEGERPQENENKPPENQKLASLYGGLSDFSNLLSNAFGSIDKNVSDLQSSTGDHVSDIKNLKLQDEKHDSRIGLLDAEVTEQREKLERCMFQVSELARNMNSQLGDATKQIRREMLTQRTSVKMDLFALNGNLRKSMNEAMELISEQSPKLLKASNMKKYNPEFSQDESIKFLVDKVGVLEEAMMIQNTVNQRLSESANQEEVVQKVYDDLFKQIEALQDQLAAAKRKNESLESNQLQMISQLRSTQNTQQRQISQLVGALMSKQKLKKFKNNMSRIAESAIESEGSFHPIRNYGRASKAPSAEGMAEGDEEEEEEAEKEKSGVHGQAPKEKEAQLSEGQEEEESAEDADLPPVLSFEDALAEAEKLKEEDRKLKREKSMSKEKSFKDKSQTASAEEKEPDAVEGTKDDADATGGTTAAASKKKQKKTTSKKRKGEKVADIEEEPEEDEEGDDEEEEDEEEEEEEEDEDSEEVEEAPRRRRKRTTSKRVARKRYYNYHKRGGGRRRGGGDDDDGKIHAGHDSDEEEADDDFDPSEDLQYNSMSKKTNKRIAVRHHKIHHHARVPPELIAQLTAAMMAQQSNITPSNSEKNLLENMSLGQDNPPSQEQIEFSDSPPSVSPTNAGGAAGGSRKGVPAEIRTRKTFDSTKSSPAPEQQAAETQTDKVERTSVSVNTDPVMESSAAESKEEEEEKQEQEQEQEQQEEFPAAAPILANDELSFDESYDSIETMDDLSAADSTHVYHVHPPGGARRGSGSGSGGGGGVSEEQLAQIRDETNKLIEALREEHSAKIDELEQAVNTFKRIAFMMDDAKVNMDRLTAKIDGMTGGATGSGTGEGAAAGNLEELKNVSLFSGIQAVKEAWNDVQGEMIIALEKFSEADSPGEGEDDDNDSLTPEQQAARKASKDFHSKAAGLVNFLDFHLEDFHVGDSSQSLQETMKFIYPALTFLYQTCCQLHAMDTAMHSAVVGEGSKQHTIRKETVEGCSYDRLICSDGNPSMKSHIDRAMALSIPLIDELIPKIDLQAQITALEKKLLMKLDIPIFKKFNEETQSDLRNKVDMKDFQTVTSKLATAAEVAKLNLYVADLGSGRGSAAGYGNQSKGGTGDGNFDMETAKLQRNADFQDMISRFEVLGKQQLELHNYCSSFVPREEVHEAMKAVIAEVKALKKSTVSHAIFRDGLKTKADTAEVEKVVKSITDAVGDLNINSPDSAAAIHAKCLICDKPVTIPGSPVAAGGPARARTSVGRGRDGRQSMVVSSSVPMIGYSKIMDDNSVDSHHYQHQQSTMFSRLTSPNPAVSQPERAKVAAELAVIRSSIDPLPDINDPSFDPQQQQQAPMVAQQGSYKERIRSNAGGGFGPKYKQDSR